VTLQRAVKVSVMITACLLTGVLCIIIGASVKLAWCFVRLYDTYDTAARTVLSDAQPPVKWVRVTCSELKGMAPDEHRGTRYGQPN
jgi:hypothetical protein